MIVRQRRNPNWRGMHVVRLFERTRQRKALAVGATARYLAEAAYWVLKKGEPYREPVPRHPAGRIDHRLRPSRARPLPNMGP